MSSCEAPAGLIGVDVGGTKTQVLALFRGQVSSWIFPSTQWRRHGDGVDEHDMVRLSSLLHALIENECLDSSTVAVCVGLHSADSEQQLDNASQWITAKIRGASLKVVNDAELLGPATGSIDNINLVIGTGTVAMGRTPKGTLARADGYGYGWLFGDFGSAPALMRESMRAIIHHSVTRSEQQVMEDPLTMELCKALDADNITDLTVLFGDIAGESTWGTLAPVFFQALAQGSQLAHDILSQAVTHIVESIDAVLRQGAVCSGIVAAGGVITHQQVMADMLQTVLDRHHPERSIPVTVLHSPPAYGALALAMRLYNEISAPERQGGATENPER